MTNKIIEIYHSIKEAIDISNEVSQSIEEIVDAGNEVSQSIEEAIDHPAVEAVVDLGGKIYQSIEESYHLNSIRNEENECPIIEPTVVGKIDIDNDSENEIVALGVFGDVYEQRPESLSVFHEGTVYNRTLPDRQQYECEYNEGEYQAGGTFNRAHTDDLIPHLFKDVTPYLMFDSWSPNIEDQTEMKTSRDGYPNPTLPEGINHPSLMGPYYTPDIASSIDVDSSQIQEDSWDNLDEGTSSLDVDSSQIQEDSWDNLDEGTSSWNTAIDSTNTNITSNSIENNIVVPVENIIE